MYVFIVNFAMAFMALAGIVMSYLMLLNHQQRYNKPSLLAVAYAVIFGALLMAGILLPLRGMQTGSYYAPTQFLDLMAVVSISLGLLMLGLSALLWREYRRLVKIQDYYSNQRFE